ncbi:MAG: hypothetical protein C9356_09315 [Oleiphilus sp.]|nr:MAG: hypothetical protein C9356_09315 [Oleiphilus sp.]
MKLLLGLLIATILTIPGYVMYAEHQLAKRRDASILSIKCYAGSSLVLTAQAREASVVDLPDGGTYFVDLASGLRQQTDLPCLLQQISRALP